MRRVSRPACPRRSATRTGSAPAQELGGKGVPQGVGSEADPAGGVCTQPDVFFEVGDDGARSPVGEPPAAAVEQQRQRVLRVRPGGALVEPVGQGGAQLGPGQGQLSQLAAVAALAADPQAALAGREGHVADVEADDLADAQPARPTAQIVVRAAAVVIVRAVAGLLLVSSLLWLFALGGVDGTSLWWIGGALGVVLVAALAPPTRRAGRAVNWGRHH